MPVIPASIEYMAYYWAKVAASGIAICEGAPAAGSPVIGSTAGPCIHYPVAAS